MKYLSHIRSSRIIICLFLLLTIGTTFHACFTEKSSAYAEGEIKARKLCSACHDYTPPEMLNKASWGNIMSVMRRIMDEQKHPYEKQDWADVYHFYNEFAPINLPLNQYDPPPSKQSIFIDSIPPGLIGFDYEFSMLEYLDSTLLLGQLDGGIFQFNPDGSHSLIQSKTIPVDYEQDAKSTMVLDMGSLGPSELYAGRLMAIKNGIEKTLIDSLHRPLDFDWVDLNQDGKKEGIVTSFGASYRNIEKSGLFIYDDKFEKIVFQDLGSGGLKSEVLDLNQDGYLDIITLFGQGNEMIKVFYGDGQLGFRQKVIATFSPLYGSNDFVLADMDGDQDLDLITSHGDNDDYSNIFKPYHGIRIHYQENDGTFQLAHFYPINGVNKVKCADYNLDGNMDFTTVSMFPNLLLQPYEQSMLFLQNKKGGFKPFYFESPSSAYYMLLESADIDHDGDEDLIVAANKQLVRNMPADLMNQWRDFPIGYKIYINETIHRVE